MSLKLPSNVRSGRMVLTSSEMEIGYQDPTGQRCMCAHQNSPSNAVTASACWVRTVRIRR